MIAFFNSFDFFNNAVGSQQTFLGCQRFFLLTFLYFDKSLESDRILKYIIKMAKPTLGYMYDRTDPGPPGIQETLVGTGVCNLRILINLIVQ